MCDAKIRPLPDDTELKCNMGDDENHVEHCAVLIGRAYPGSLTTIHWYETDRRNFRGLWTDCPRTEGCVLPGAHRGECAV